MRREPDIAMLAEGVRAGRRDLLARAITLIESRAPRHREPAQQVLARVLEATGQSVRIGITGVPGVGKSTFIEALGLYLCEQGHRVAVLAIDPSSSITRGSILGDKTRMERLGRHPRAYIRPSPAAGTLGGVARRSRETMLLCEAAGFDVILVETVGVGQSETTVRGMVDFFLLLMLANAGDELQGIKKGIIELADALMINKADGDNQLAAQAARVEYARALHYLTSATEGWTPEVLTCSALQGQGIEALWALIERFRAQGDTSGSWAGRRRQQALDWMQAAIENELLDRFIAHTQVRAQRPAIEQAVLTGTLPPTLAAHQLLSYYFDQHSS